MIHYVGIPVHHFHGAGGRGLHLVLRRFGYFMRIKFAAANTAEDNENDVWAAGEGAAFRSLKLDWRQKSGRHCADTSVPEKADLAARECPPSVARSEQCARSPAAVSQRHNANYFQH
jgi:hypothetical protein